MLQKNVEWTSNVGHFDSVTQWQRLQANTRRISVYFDEFYRHKVFKKKKKQTSKLQVTYLEMSEAPGNHKVANLIFKLSLIREGFHETSWFEREFLRQIWHFDNYQKSLATRHAVSLVEFSESFTYHYCSSCVTITYKPIWLTDVFIYVLLRYSSCVQTERKFDHGCLAPAVSEQASEQAGSADKTNG